MIRLFHPNDAETLTDIYVRSVCEIGSRFYSPAQIDAWAGRTPSAEIWAEMMTDGRFCLVAIDDQDKARAFGDLEADGHIDFLYAHPDVAGTGVVAALYQELEAEACRQGIARLYVEASEAARGFFQRQGFTLLHRRDFDVDGVAIHNYAMEKRL